MLKKTSMITLAPVKNYMLIVVKSLLTNFIKKIIKKKAKEILRRSE